jgi:UDP-N-acetyl-D-galactosamine dehydrogenase
MQDTNSIRIGIIGLGYVGLPLAVEFGRIFTTVGFDLNESRVTELQAGDDSTREVEPAELKAATRLTCSADPGVLAACNIYIIAVPTPIDASRRPNLLPLRSASELVGRYLDQQDIVIYESTVYPGATEEVCVPILERESGLQFNLEFFCGYSPERINPGDKQHRLPDIVKITSGSDQATADKVDDLYRAIIRAGTFPVSSMKVAEAAKVIENTQRDVNIALVNELALIFHRLGISTREVLEAAGSKWNFLPFTPGLVGGHCIGVDPYYLTHKAQEVGYHPAMILAGRRLNDEMGKYVAGRVIKLMIQKKIKVSGAKVLILGLAFKENCPDIRNTKVIDIIDELADYGLTVDICDPWVDPREAKIEYGLDVSAAFTDQSYDAIVLAVAHGEFINLAAADFDQLLKPRAVLFDVKSVLPQSLVDGTL